MDFLQKYSVLYSFNIVAQLLLLFFLHHEGFGLYKGGELLPVQSWFLVLGLFIHYWIIPFNSDCKPLSEDDRRSVQDKRIALESHVRLTTKVWESV